MNNVDDDTYDVSLDGYGHLIEMETGKINTEIHACEVVNKNISNFLFILFLHYWAK